MSTVVAAAPVRIAAIAVVAVLLTVLLRFVVGRVVRRLSRLPARAASVSDRAKVVIGDPNRAGQRLRTFQSVLNSTVAIVIGTVALVMVLSELDVNVAPLLASAGVVGVALAFGAQSLVRDVISGIFMLVEDQYGVGDRVELGAVGVIMASGTVERVALRITTIRDDDGRVWHVRNGEVLRVANESQGWSQAVAQVRVLPDADVEAAREAMTAVTQALRSGPLGDAIMGDAEVLVEDVAGSGITLRWIVRTRSGRQWQVASAMRRELPAALAGRGVTLAD